MVDEVKNFAANILYQVSVLVTYWEPCIFLVSHLLGSMQKWWRSYIEKFKGSEAIEDFYCKFIYGDNRV